MRTTRVLVCGGREYNNVEKVNAALTQLSNYLPEAIQIIHGCATGADTLGGEWAKRRGSVPQEFPIAPGESGFARNTRMLAVGRPDICVHFPGGRGTRDMVRKCREDYVEICPGLNVDQFLVRLGLLPVNGDPEPVLKFDPAGTVDANEVFEGELVGRTADGKPVWREKRSWKK